MTDEKDKEGEQKIAITLDANTGTLDQNGSYSKNLEVSHNELHRVNKLGLH